MVARSRPGHHALGVEPAVGLEWRSIGEPESRPSCCPRSRDPLPGAAGCRQTSAEAVGSERSDSSARFGIRDRTEPGERSFDEPV